MKGEKYVLKKSSVMTYTHPNMWTLFVWVCPLCGRRVVSYSRTRALQSARYHLERGHKLVVEVNEYE